MTPRRHNPHPRHKRCSTAATSAGAEPPHRNAPSTIREPTPLIIHVSLHHYQHQPPASPAASIDFISSQPFYSPTQQIPALVSHTAAPLFSRPTRVGRHTNRAYSGQGRHGRCNTISSGDFDLDVGLDDRAVSRTQASWPSPYAAAATDSLWLRLRPRHCFLALR
jgi:hypothetical protein